MVFEFYQRSLAREDIEWKDTSKNPTVQEVVVCSEVVKMVGSGGGLRVVRQGRRHLLLLLLPSFSRGGLLQNHLEKHGKVGGSLAPLPPMGWMSWERFRCETNCAAFPDACIDENLYRNMTERLAADGYLMAGYNMINIDDCWMADARDADGVQIPNATRFPSGMKYMGDFMHSRGIRFGLYTDEGTETCGGYPGSQGYEELDVQTYASWGVDFIKVDGCHNDEAGFEVGYPAFGKALAASGRDITFSCSWPAYLGDDEGAKPFQSFADAGCDTWRNWNDVDNSWSSVVTIADHWGDYSSVLSENSGPGFGWNDPDMVLAGDDHYEEGQDANGTSLRLSVDQAKFQLSIWSIVAAPLIMSNDLRTVPDEYKELLLNPEMIAVDQDALGVAGGRLNAEKNTTEAWARPLEDGSLAVALVNKGGGPGGLSDDCAWHVTPGAYRDAGAAGNIECASWASLKKLRETCCGDSACTTFSAYNGAFDETGLFGCTRNALAMDPSSATRTVNADYDGWTKLSGGAGKGGRRGSSSSGSGSGSSSGSGSGKTFDDDDDDDAAETATVSVSFEALAEYVGVDAFFSAVSVCFLVLRACVRALCCAVSSPHSCFFLRPPHRSTTQAVRDLWAREDLGTFAGGSFTAEVPSTGVVFVKVTPS
jgi:uncharacterized membrane protein YgcG